MPELSTQMITQRPRFEPRPGKARARSGVAFTLTFHLSLVLLVAVSGAGHAGQRQAAPTPLPEVTTDESASVADTSARTPAALVAEMYDRISILGSDSDRTSLPGSSWLIPAAQLEEQAQTDIHRVLLQVPGVIVQEEDGLGLRPNIGIRGTGVERSSKITLLEDGVLIAPAPYTAPSAYYFPTVARMEGIEVRKGSVAIIQGPSTTGGAINLLSRSIPAQIGGSAHLSAQEHGGLITRGFVGGSRERVGWLLDLLRSESDGFKELDGPESDTGTTVRDAVGKFRLSSDPSARLHQVFELKLGWTDQLGHETYLGLTQADFQEQPYRRYAGSARDRIDTEHSQIQGRYLIKPSPAWDAVLTVYDNDFYRDWFKNEGILGVSNSAILDDPERYPQELAILRGETDSPIDALSLRHNRRDYRSRGAQSLVTWNSDHGRHSFEFGARYHQDSEDRRHSDDGYQIVSARLLETSRGVPGSQTNRLSNAAAVALHAQDILRLGDFTVRLGLRLESIDYVRSDFSTSDPARLSGPTRVRENGVDVILPGLGVSYELSPNQSLFAGLHRGFSPPGAGQSPETKEETSDNLEIGYRRIGPGWGLEAVGFATDYDNLLGTDTLSGGGSSAGERFNGGRVEVRGLELSTRTTLRPNRNWSIPIRAAYTLTRAEFQTAFNTEFEDWAPRVERGDELPYLPESQVNLTVGVDRGPFSLVTDLSWLEETRSTAGQGRIPASQTIDARWLIDATARYRLTDRWAIFLQGRNLLDHVYLVARRPYGVRPGLDRSLAIGVDLDF